MKIKSFSYTQQTGWSVDPLPPLDSENTLVLVFAAPEFLDSPEPISQIVKAFRKSHVVGCSTAGEILGSALSDHSLAAVAVQFEHSRLAITSAEVHSAHDSFNAGRTIAESLKAPNLQGVLILSDGSNVNGSELVYGINLPGQVIITGGLAGDGDRFKRTWVIAEGKPRTGVVVAIGIYGEKLSIGFGSQGGWERKGSEWTITRSDENVLYELNGQPALRVYKEAIGEAAAQGLPASALLFPLAVRANATDRQPMVRTILSVNEAKQSMTFAGDVPEGYLAQLMSAELDKLIDSAATAATLTKTVANGGEAQDTLCIAISCVGRRLVLGERTKEELAATLRVLPPNTQQVGFYSYGEISPSGGYCDLHNQTMTITTIREG